MLLILFLKVEIEYTFVFPNWGNKYTGKKSKDKVAFGKSTLLKHLIQNYYYIVGNSLLIYKICIPMRIDLAPYWANLFLYKYENEYMSELISNDKVKACHFHITKYFIDNLGISNDEGVFNDV